MASRTITSPLGPIHLIEQDGAITALNWGVGGADDSDLLRRGDTQLSAYFAGEIDAFDLPLQVAGSPTQVAVCRAMQAMPPGQTRTYGDLAHKLRLSAQAVGQACGGNPIPIIIPCHRVLGARGIGGFSARGGVETKVWLLKHEGAGSLLI